MAVRVQTFRLRDEIVRPAPEAEPMPTFTSLLAAFCAFSASLAARSASSWASMLPDCAVSISFSLAAAASASASSCALRLRSASSAFFLSTQTFAFASITSSARL